MAVFTYGNNTNDYVEIPDPATPNQTIRPTAGTTVQVRDASTNAALPSVQTGAYGYLSFTASAPVVLVSTDNFATSKRLVGGEAELAALTAAVDASSALSLANGNLTKINQLTTRVSTLEAGGGTGGGSTFTGTVDWVSQVMNKPTLTANALGALPATARGAADGVAALSGGLVPIGQLPVGTGTAQVAPGAHVHAVSWATAPPGSYCRVDETSAGVYPAPATARADIVRRFRGSIRPTEAQGAQAGDEWVNTGAV